MRLVVMALAGSLVMGTASAEQRLAPVQQPPVSVSLTYDGYIAGLNAMKLRAGMQLSPDGYDIGVNFRTAGLVGAVLSGNMLTRSTGSWVGSRAVPSSYKSAGVWRGVQREAQIDYPDGQPHIKVLTADDEDHEPVPPAMTKDTMDALSAVAFLVHTVTTTGKCDGDITTYDGRRVSEIKARTVGMETLPPESRSSYSGPAMRCDLQTHQTAGFPPDAGPDDMVHKINHSSVWLIPAKPGMAPVPARMSFEVRLFGHLTIYLTSMQPEARLASFSPRIK